MASRNIKIKIIESNEDFAALREQWNELLASSEANTIFLTWEWLYTWWQHFNHDRQLTIVLIEDNNQLVGIAPLFRENTRVRGFISMQTLQWLGVGEVGSDYLNIICKPGYEEDVCKLVCEEVCNNIKQWDLLRFTDLPSGGKTYTSFHKFFNKNNRFEYQIGREYICPYIKLENYTWESFLESLSVNMRYNLRRRNKQVFNQLGAKVMYCNKKEDIEPFLNSIFDLHLRRWETRGGSDGFSTPEVHVFHQDVAVKFFTKNWLRLYLLEVNSQAIAGIYGFEYGNSFYFYQSGMLPELERYSVGMVLMGQTIKDSISHHLATYDFLHGTESYKFKWTQKLRSTSSLIICPRNKFVPKIYFLMRTLKQKLSQPSLQTANLFPGS